MAQYKDLRPRRRRIFMGVEGESERSLVRWWKHLCDEAESHVHLDVVVGGGGDGLAIAEFAVKRYRQRTERLGRFAAGFIVLDADRVEEDRRRGRDPATAVQPFDIQLIYLRPNLEGLLFRLFPGNERRRVSASHANRLLRRKWPGYSKPASAMELRSRFTLDDVRRVGEVDAELGQLLQALGLFGADREP